MLGEKWESKHQSCASKKLKQKTEILWFSHVQQRHATFNTSLIMTPGPPCSGNVDPLGWRLSSLAALSATETRDKWRVCHGPESRTPARSRSYFLTCTHTFTHRGMESGPSCKSVNHPRDLIHPCFCVSGQPHRSCLHFSNITGFSTAQRPGSPTGPLGASTRVFSRARDEIYV